MSDGDLALWLQACHFLRAHAQTIETRQIWGDRLIEAEGERLSRSAGDC